MQWDPPTEASLEESLQALQEIYQHHLIKEPPGSPTTRRWARWEECRLALEAAEEALRKVQVMNGILASHLSNDQKQSLYEAVLELGYEKGLDYLNQERAKRGDPRLCFHGVYLIQEEDRCDELTIPTY